MVDLVLVNPNNRPAAPFAAIEPPLWLGLIAGYGQSLGQKVAIVDAEAEGLTVTETIIRVKGLHPKRTMIVVMGNNPSVSSTPKMPIAEKLLGFMAEAELTGLHPMATHYPHCVTSPFQGFPNVPWDLLPMHLYKAHNWHCLEDIDNRSPYGVLYTSLNCPYDCFYCNIHALYGDRTIKYRPLEDIYKELIYFAEHGIKHIKVWDELFTLNESRVNQICDYIISEGFSFNLWAYARVDTINKRKVDKLKRAGFNWLAFGFESQSQPVRLMAGKGFSGLQVEQAIQMTREAGINIIANFMFGLPGETEADMQASLDMAERENFEYVNFNIALPYPGSEWYASLKEKPTDWSSFSQFSPNICALPEIVKLRDKAFRHYFSRPEYLNMINGKFGPKAEAHIKEMLQWLVR